MIYYETSNGKTFKDKCDARMEEVIIRIEDLIREHSEYPLEINFSDPRAIAEWIITNSYFLEDGFRELKKAEK